MLLSIILAFVIVALIAAAEHLFANRGVDGWNYSAIDLGECSRALGIGGTIGIVNYFSPKLSGGWLLIAPIFMLAMVVIFLWLTFRGRERFSLLGFCLMVGAALWSVFTFKSAAEATIVLLKADGFWRELIRGVPWGFFILLTGGTLVFALKAEADSHQEENRARIFFGLSRVAAFVVALLIIASLLNFKWPFWSNASERVTEPIESSEVVTTEAAKETETETETKPVVEDTRDPRFIQEEVSHKNWRLCFDFSNRMTENAHENLRVELIPEDTTATILDLAGHNAELLAIYAQGLGLYPDSSQYKELLNADETYLSEKGIALYYRLEGALSVCKVDRASAPYDGTNTGYDGGFVVASQPGISGDSKATRYTTPSGKVFYVMDRCGNFVYPDPPKDISRGNTDEPPKKDKTKGTQGNLVAPGDNPGPGPSTNNGVGAQTSSADEPSKSSSTQTYTEYKEEAKKTNEAQKPVQETQKQSGDSNQPTTTEPSANVDNNGATGNGNGSADTPTPVQPPQNIEEGDTPISTQPGGSLGEPDD